MADVFISYAREDKDFVIRLNDALKVRQREGWVDLEDIPPIF
ncbi:MAG: TIR domain-containing protein [Desulfobaccales bacterium]